jgi:hypothetical protein
LLRSLPVLIFAGLFAFYLLFAYVLFEPIAKRTLPWVAENSLASRAQIDSLDFDPFRLALTVRGMRLTEADGQLLAGFERLHVDIDSFGLFRWALRFTDIQLDRPQGRLVVRKGGTLNWSTLLAAIQKDDTPPSDTVLRVLIDHIALTRGDLEYRDENRPTPFVSRLTPLGVELDGLSTLPDDRGKYLIAARLPDQGGVLKWRGEVGLNPLASSGEIGLEKLDLAKLARVVPAASRGFDLASGQLAAGARYRFALLKDKPWLQIDGLNARVDALAAQAAGLNARLGSLTLENGRYDLLTGRAQLASLEAKAASLAGKGAPWLTLPVARLTGLKADLSARLLTLARMQLTGLDFKAQRDRQGRVDLGFAPTDPGPADAVPVPPKTPAPASAPWQFSLEQFALAEGRARYDDQGFVRPLSAQVAGIYLNTAVSARFGAGPAAVMLSALEAGTAAVSLHSGGRPLAQLAGIQARGGAFDGKAFSLREVVIRSPQTRLDIAADRQINWQQALLPARAPQPPAGAKPAAKPASPLAVSLDTLRIENLGLGFSDRSLAQPVALDIAGGRVELRKLSGDLRQALPVRVDLPVRQGGRLKLSGRVAPQPLKGKLEVVVEKIPLLPLAPYVNQAARLVLESGEVNTRGTVQLSERAGQPSVGFAGGFAVETLSIREEDTGEAFLAWKSLASRDVEAGFNPGRLQIGTLSAAQPVAKIIIYPDRSLNLTRILRSSPPAADPAGAAPPAAPPPRREDAGAPAAGTSTATAADFALGIERVRIDTGQLEFADLSLTPQFGTRINALSGVINGLSTDPASTAQVELDGKVDDYGSARVRGSLQPFRATDFTDLKLSFRNLEMARLTPYSGKFAGRRIESGKLSVDLEYKIKNRQLAGENAFIVNRLRLGERVESSDAANLPLDLAIALLEDSNGVIDLDLPVSGSLDDPQFSYGGLIWKAVVNVLTKIVTAPFRALGNLLGISGDKLQALAFDPGAAQLAPPEQEKLKAVGQALAKRPALVLKVQPVYAREADTRALQVDWVRREVAQGLGIALKPDEAPGPVDGTNPKTRKVLDALYQQRFAGQGGIKALQAGFDKAKTPPAEQAAQIIEKLVQAIPVSPGELERLARSRAQNVVSVLAADGVPAARVSLVDKPVGTEAGDRVSMKLELGVSKPANP